MTVSDFDEVTQSRAGEEPARPGAPHGRPQQQRPHHDAPPGRRPQAPLPDHRLQAHQGRRAGDGRRDRVRPEPLGADRAAALRGRREGLHPRAAAAEVGATVQSGAGRRHPARQLPAAVRDPDRHDGARHRAAARPGRAHGRLRRHVARSSSPRRAARRSCACPPASCAACRSPCRATIGQVGNATHQNESGGKAGRARWLGKRPGVRGTAMNPVDHPHGGGEGKNKGSHPVTPVGQADARPPHAQSQEGLLRGHRPRPQARQGQEVDDE